MDREKVLFQPVVSVIVPVYNAGAYLPKRIDSLLQQTLRNIEILFVVDCPTDGSQRLIEECATGNSRVKVLVNRTNLHIGLSRNKGLEAATGEYVAFADHDDYCDPEMYEKLYITAKACDADLVFSDMYLEKAGQKISKEYLKKAGELSREKILRELLKGDGFYYSVLSHLYKRSFLKQYGIQFVDTRMVTLEDRYFNLLAYQQAKKVVHLPEKLMSHLIYAGSTQHSYAFKSLQPMINHLEKISIFFHAYPEYQEIYRQEFCVEVVRGLLNAFLPEVRYKSIFYAFRRLRQIKDKPGIQESLMNYRLLSGRKGNWKIRCFYLLLKFYRVRD